MPYDAGVAAAVKTELNEKLLGGRVEKITQPTKEEIIFNIYSMGERYRLVLDADANNPKVYITEHERENPPVPPMFCNILRKYLQNAKIAGISQVGFDRIFEFKFDAFDDMGFSKPIYLYVECIRKQSNIILCGVNVEDSEDSKNEENSVKKIISAVKAVDFSLSIKRQILPGLAYLPPPVGDSENKTNPLEISKAQFLENFIAAAKDSDIPLESYLLSKYQGLSPLITREIAFLSCKDTEILMSEAVQNAERIWVYFNAIMQNLRESKFTPTLLYKFADGDKNNKADKIYEIDNIDKPELALMDFSYADISQYGSKAVAKNYVSMSELIDYYFYKKDYDNRIRQKSQDIFKVLSNATSRLNKKTRLLEKDLEDCKNKEGFKIYGDLITANIYRLEKGMNTVEAENYYDDNKIIKIPLDANLTPPQNAQKYYKRYSKLKTAEYHIAKQLENAQNDIIYIDSVFNSLTRTLSERELAEIRDELAESGIIKRKAANIKTKPGKSGKKPKQLPVSKPDEFKSTNGFKILCGKNNKQNDDLTFRIAGKTDIWLHTQKIPGSHIVLLCENSGKTPSDKDIEDAAKIAAAHSKGKNMPIVPVDYTLVKYVKKPTGAKPGFVIYNNFKTANVRPAEIDT